MEHQPHNPKINHQETAEPETAMSGEAENILHQSEQIDTADPERQPERPSPMIYVVSIADEAAGFTHAAWIRADQPAKDIHADISALLNSSPDRHHLAKAAHSKPAQGPRARLGGSAGWEIRDHKNFNGITPYGEVDLDRLSILSTGLALHGPVFGLFAEHLGHEFPPEQWSSKFEDLYMGSEPTMEICIDHFLDAMGWTGALAFFLETEGIDEEFIAFRRKTITALYLETYTVLTDQTGAVHVFRK